MKSVLFFTQPRWAYAQIHHALIKRLWVEGIYSHLLDWTVNYTVEEMEMLSDSYDLFVTHPEAVHILNSGGIPNDRIIAVAHCERDIAIAVHERGTGFFNELYGYAGVNRDLIEVSKNMGVQRAMKIVRIGVDADHFYAEPPTRLETVGYAGAMEAWLSHGPEIKRGRLFVQICDRLGLQKIVHNKYHHLCMPGFYLNCDAVMVTSSSETVGLPILEGAAAGRLVLSALVGYANGKQGVICRTPDDEFVEDAIAALSFYRSNPRAFREVCAHHQQHVCETHDWEACIKDWYELIQNGKHP
jgi:hypothetical protein